MNRRTFLSLTGVAGSGVALGVPNLFSAASPREANVSSTESTVPDTGWRLWRDEAAAWKNDRLYLPDDVPLASLPVNPPTGGWDVLTASNGLEVTLPATVEQFFWGASGFRPYANEYKFETSDAEVKNGAYDGVSWWWRTLDIPAAFLGRRILLHVRGARQRAEVYLNRQLVGYSMLEELPFECDLTPAARAGANELAIRITNPGGRLDWVDTARVKWGEVEFQKSHGFGGLDRGLTLTAHGPLRIEDAWVLNRPEPRQIEAHAQIENASGTARRAQIRFAVIDPANGDELSSVVVDAEVPARGRTSSTVQLEAPRATLWDLATPRLYVLRTTCREGQECDVRETEFGFRWITVDGLGRDAVIRLNGRRIRIYTSISWGFWALNGLFPTPELAEKEVRAAQAFGLNCLNFHRNLAKPEVLRLQDRAGLLRCLEPGGGIQAIAPRNRPAGFAERYMLAKITGMIRAFRSHPSVVHYIIQNEGRIDPANPALLEVFAAMHAVDPSRAIIGSDGFVMRSPQAWSAPYDATVQRNDRPASAAGGAAGWWVDHSGRGTDVWQDGCYRGPGDYYYQSPVRREIVEWGEMKGPASSDDHASVLEEIRRHGGKSYDRLDHARFLAAYDAFFDRWSFRGAFPRASDLFRSIGRRAYESWGQLMENVRISDETDMAAISGWESTAIENHSGLVDNFRDFKANPRAIAESLQLVRPVAKQRQLALEIGQPAIFDLYLLNDSDAPVPGTLTFTLTAPDGAEALREQHPTPAFQRDRLSYLVREGVTSPALDKAGRWRAQLALDGRPEVTHQRELLVVDLPPLTPAKVVALADVSDAMARAFNGLPGVTIEHFQPGKRYDVVVFSGVGEPAAKPARTDVDGADITATAGTHAGLSPQVLAAVQGGTPLLVLPAADNVAERVARQLSDLGAFHFNGMVGSSRASWMGAWYFVRAHPLYEGLPVNEALGSYYQVKSSGSNGWRIDGTNLEIVAGYGRDHDCNLGAGTFTARLGNSRLVLHHVTGMHAALHRRFLLNAIRFLTT